MEDLRDLINDHRPAYLPLLLLSGIAISETLLLSGFAVVGLLGYVIILQVSLYASAVRWKYEPYRALVVIGIIPVLRMAGYSFSLVSFSPTVWYALLWTVGLVAILTSRQVLSYSLADIGLSLRSFWLQPVIALMGIVFGALFVFSGVETVTTQLASNESLLWFPAVLVLAGVCEELLFRGLMRRSMVVVLGDAERSSLYIAILYALLQVGHGSWLLVGLAFSMSLLFSWLVQRTGSVLGVGLAHGILNVMVAYSGVLLLWLTEFVPLA